MAGKGIIKWPAQYATTGTDIKTDDPMTISYGRIAMYGTLKINANTDNSGAEYVLLTAGKGLSETLTDGLAIGSSTLQWQGKDVIHGGNISSQSVASATKATQDGSGNTITSTYVTKTATLVTLNGTAKTANSTASFYAPTAKGTAG
jgi:hypothetical protein